MRLQRRIRYHVDMGQGKIAPVDGMIAGIPGSCDIGIVRARQKTVNIVLCARIRSGIEVFDIIAAGLHHGHENRRKAGIIAQVQRLQWRISGDHRIVDIYRRLEEIGVRRLRRRQQGQKALLTRK